MFYFRIYLARALSDLEIPYQVLNENFKTHKMKTSERKSGEYKTGCCHFHVNCLRSSSGHQLGESALLNKTSLNVLAPDFSRPCCQTRPSQQKLAGWCCWWTSCPRPLSIPDDDGQHGVNVVDEHMFGLLSTFIFVFLFVYLFICLFHIWMIDIIESHAFKKYSTCWVF